MVAASRRLPMTAMWRDPESGDVMGRFGSGRDTFVASFGPRGDAYAEDVLSAFGRDEAISVVQRSADPEDWAPARMGGAGSAGPREIEASLRRHFGVTDDIREAGYILSDGTLVDLSGRHYAADYVRRGDRFVPRRGPDWLAGQRMVDHRELPEEMEDALGKRGGEAMLALLAETGILRVMPGVGFSVVRMPSVEAIVALVAGWRRAYRADSVVVDVLNREGFTEDTAEVPEPTVDRIENFLESAFGGGRRRTRMSALGGTTPTDREIDEAYRRNYERLRDTVDAWNATLDEVAGPFDPEAPEERNRKRGEVADRLRKIQRKLDLELGDLCEVAIDGIMKSLRGDRVVSAVKSEWRNFEREMRAQFEGRPGGAPEEWSPKVRVDPGRRRARTFEDFMEGVESPYLYVMFDEQGRLDGWEIEAADYFRGHGGPVASVPVHETVDYGDIEGEIRETLGQADIQWGAEEGEGD